MITDRELSEQLADGELGYVSAEFWERNSVLGKMNPDHPVWDKLKAFQAGWVACKEFYKIST